jgi:chromate transporter
VPRLVAMHRGEQSRCLVFELAFAIVIAAAAVVGYTARRVRLALFVAKPQMAHGDVEAPLIADDALHGEHPSLSRAVKVIVVGAVLWATPVIATGAIVGRSHVFAEQGLFFSGTAVVTFGGAYAVLSFVAQRAVDVYHWLLPGGMVNRLALAEATPGPLIMVVQFVGFLGAYRNPGDLDPWIAGMLGASVP